MVIDLSIVLISADSPGIVFVPGTIDELQDQLGALQEQCTAAHAANESLRQEVQATLAAERQRMALTNEERQLKNAKLVKQLQGQIADLEQQLDDQDRRLRFEMQRASESDSKKVREHCLVMTGRISTIHDLPRWLEFRADTCEFPLSLALNRQDSSLAPAFFRPAWKRRCGWRR